MIRRSFIIAVPLAALFSLTACGSSASPTGGANGATAGATPAPSAGSTPVPSAPAGALPVTLADFMITAPSGVPTGGVTFAVTNNGPSPHQFTVETADGHVAGATPMLNPHSMTTLTVSLVSGTYTYLCALPGHASLGMHGIFTAS